MGLMFLAYRPKALSVFERAHQTIKGILRKLTVKQPKLWRRLQAHCYLPPEVVKMFLYSALLSYHMVVLTEHIQLFERVLDQE